MKIKLKFKEEFIMLELQLYMGGTAIVFAIAAVILYAREDAFELIKGIFRK